VRIVHGFSSFKLVGPPLQPAVVGPYEVHGSWLPSHLPLEGTRLYPDLLDHNWQPMVPGVQDPDSSRRAFRRVSGWVVHSMGGRISTHILLWALPRDSVVGHGARASMVITWNPMVEPTM
jgi:hypothetical protein